MSARIAEQRRLDECANAGVPWKRWGPYLSERQWGTVREDYSDNGNAWDYFPHDQARSRAYRWGEDGLGGVSDDEQRLCFALALWNGRDPILKERLYGLTNSEGNHGEDVKEYYFYLDSTPTHSYMKFLYKYPQAEFPYAKLIEENKARGRAGQEYELIDTGVFDDDRYFDVFVEYAKAAPDDILVRITACNRGPDVATLHLLPTLWFRNTWSWGQEVERPSLTAAGERVIVARHAELGRQELVCGGQPALLFTENETNHARLWGQANASPWTKDAFHEYVIHGDIAAVNPARTGTKAAALYVLEVPARGEKVVQLRLSPRLALADGPDFDRVFKDRLAEADRFYDVITPDRLSADEHRVMRQALAGMLWSKQYYYFDLDRWLSEHGSNPVRGAFVRSTRNVDWFHMRNSDVISMPDKWEYPWYAAWDLAFHTLALSMVDIDFAKQQLQLMLREVYLHPSGQIPAYEWNFGDVNPPVHAWATLFVYSADRGKSGRGDLDFLRHSFQMLLFNFNWWLNRKDPTGRNVFTGGFLGLDNIGVFDRSAPLPTGGHLEQADGTAWMAFYCQNMLEIALELAADDPDYEDLAYKFAEHFLWIAHAMDRIGEHADEMWDEADGFFYDVLRLPDGRAGRLKVRSMVGLLPLCATTVFPADSAERFPKLMKRLGEFLERNPDLRRLLNPRERSPQGRPMLALLDEQKLRRVLARMLDEAEFLAPGGIRSLSRHHLDHPFGVQLDGNRYEVRYLPAESDSGMFGGNSNWRGPVWMPVNALIIRALLQFYAYYGDAFRVEYPTGSGRELTLFEVAHQLSDRLAGIFLRGLDGRRPVYGGTEKFQADPHWRDLILFYEYFHGDNSAGIGASHQTGWTGVVARFMQLFGHLEARDLVNAANLRPLARYYRE
ncbi:MAG TPA: hypothetical protein PL152_00890 [Steroidobacteraceae bacterium]|nr:hypothetical protein [Steroidobacteraceae bacterium]